MAAVRNGEETLESNPCLPVWLRLPPSRNMRSRTEPEGIFIGASSPYSNPFAINLAPAEAVKKFADWLPDQPELLRLIRQKMPGSAIREAPHSEHVEIFRDIAAGRWDHMIPDEPIFVFGSNLSGKHGLGAAVDAREQYGAENGVGQGLTGYSYALPTKSHNVKALELVDVLSHIDEFMAFAEANPMLPFRLTKVGTGLTGLPEELVRDHVLKHVPANVQLPGTWEAFRNPSLARIIIAGSREFTDYELMSRKLDLLLSRLGDVEIVSGGARGADMLGERYAIERSLKLRRMPAYWSAFRLKAGPIRNRRMSWYGTHLVAFWNGKSTGTRSMLSIADDAHLQVRTVRF